MSRHGSPARSPWKSSTKSPKKTPLKISNGQVNGFGDGSEGELSDKGETISSKRPRKHQQSPEKHSKKFTKTQSKGKTGSQKSKHIDTVSIEPSDEAAKKVDAESLFKMARKCRFVAPIMTKIDDLPKLLEEQELESDLKIPQNLIRSDRMKSLKEDHIPAGEWEVEAIVDSGMDDDGSIKYLVRWKGWDGDDTWEPSSNLANSVHLVREYLNTLSKRDETEAHKRLIQLVLVLKKVTLQTAQIDEGLLLKLCQKDLTYTENKNWQKELQKYLAQKCSLALDFLVRGPGELGTPGALLETTIKELKINETFGSLDEMFEWMSGREEQEEGNRKRMEEINAAILKLKDGPTMTIENYVDNEVVPNFQYSKEYKPYDIIYNSDPVVKCTCEDCYEQKKPKKGMEGFCCWHESPKRPYSKNGVLLLDEREPIYECNSTCACPPSCPFKVVSKGRVYQFGIFRTANGRGWGLKALEKIPKGKFVITYAGELITADERDGRALKQNKNHATYLFDLDYSAEADEALFAIDAIKVANLARFINHSCNPNLVVHPCWVHNMDINLPIIAFFSNRLILKGEELTFDYNVRKTEENEEQKKRREDEDVENENEPPPVFGCKCGVENCKGFYI